MAQRRARGTVRWTWIVVCCIVIAAGAWIALGFLRPIVTLTEVVEGPVVQAFYATGTLQPDREYTIRCKTAGIVAKPQKDKPYPDKGDHVSTGQPLAIVQDSELAFTVDKARAELQERRQRSDEKTSPVIHEFTTKITVTAELLEIARREQDRVARLVESHAASESDFDKSLNTVKTLESDLASLKSELESAKLQLQRELEVAESALRIAEWNEQQQTLVSPIDGVILDRPTSLGTRLAANDHIMQVADVRPEKLIMRAQVDEEDITQVHVDPARPQIVRITLYAFPGRSFEGRVARIYDKADQDRRTFEVDVALAAPDTRMAAGMTGELAFIVADKASARVVPSQAVQDGAVWTVRDGRLRKLQATIGIKSIERVEIASGLSPGDSVAISPLGKLTDGQRVRTDHADPIAAAALNKPKTGDNFKGFN